MKSLVLAALAATAFVAGPNVAAAYDGHGPSFERHHHRVCFMRHHHRVCRIR